MLSVRGSGGRSRSKSPGRRDERSRSQDIRAPSPSRRVPQPNVGPPPSRSKKSYDDEDEVEDPISDDSDDRRMHNYSRAIEKVRPREHDGIHSRGNIYKDNEYDDDDDDDDDAPASSRYPDSRRPDYTRQEDMQSRGSTREHLYRDKNYAVPGQFNEEEEDRSHNRKERDRYAQPASGHNRAPSTSMGSRGGYETMPKWQYAQIDPKQLSYVNKPGQPQYTRTPVESGPTYVRNPQANMTVESSRHRRADRYEELDDRYSGGRYRDTEDRKRESDRARARIEERKKEHNRPEKDREELVRRTKEREEFDMIEEKKRELDRLKKERDEVEADLRQKRSAKMVTIQDNRDRKMDDYDYNYNYSRRPEENEVNRRRRRRPYDEESPSEESDNEERLQRLYYNRDKEHNDSQYEEQHFSRRNEKRRDAPENKYEKYERDGRRRESDAKGNKAQIVEIHPSGRGSLAAPASPGLSTSTRRLSVAGRAAGSMSLALPGSGHSRRNSVSAAPGSPLLESYKGTYQTISPMPSPMALSRYPDDSDLSDLDLDIPGKLKKYDDSDELEDDSDASRSERKPKSILKRRLELGEQYDPEDDAITLAAELKRSTPSAGLLVKILPTLRNENIALLRTEYKKHAKIQGKGINLAKHIKMKLSSNNIGKAAYATALGRWESEAHWANFWYQSGSSRRELLIEALFGRSNAEIKAIKESFSDKRYGDSLVKCMEAELKKDKFRLAVLKALEAKRGEEADQIDSKLVYKDITDLHKAVTSKDGGETALINIIVVRSDEHLRAVLQKYEEKYEENFARSMIKKSQNLVGETLAHILNGVLNRPVRDALLLRQAIAETSKDRAELIISRLVRFHWEPKHLERIKVEYHRRYKTRLEQDIHDGTKGDFSAFCIGLCQGAVR